MTTADGTSRRDFLGRSAALAVGGSVFAAPATRFGSDPDRGGMWRTPGAIDPDDPASWRAEFDLRPDVAHFAAYVMAAHPRRVREAIEEHRRGLDADAEGYILAHQFELEEAAVGAAAAYLGGRFDDIALTDSTTMGLGVVYGGLRLRDGDEVITTSHDFYSTHESLRRRAAQTGAQIVTVTLYEDPASASSARIVETLIDAITPRTRAMAITWTHSGTGVKLPVAAIGEALATVNAEREVAERVLLCVDAVHAFGVEVETPAQIGCDVLITGTHKWLFGPRGTGLVWASDAARARIDPVIAPFEGASFLGWLEDTAPSGPVTGARLSPGGYHSFEHRWALGEAFALHADIGRLRVAEHTHGQATQLKEGLAELSGITVVTPLDASLSSAIVCIDRASGPVIELMPPLIEAGYLSSVTPYRDTYLRFGPSIVTTPDEVDGLLAALADLL